MKVLIITYYWPPAGGSGVQRWLKFVKYLQNYGITPVVFTPANAKYPITDASLLKELPKNITVLQLPITNPQDYVSFFTPKHKKTKQAGVANLSKGGFLSWVRGNFFIPDAKKYWIKPAVKYLTNYIENNTIDAIISTGPPHSMHLIAQQLKRNLGLKWIADFRDPWTSLYYNEDFNLSSFAKQKNKALEKSVLKEADTVITVSKQLQKELEETAQKVALIPNGYDDEVLINEALSLDSKFSLAHIGLLPTQSNPQILWEVLKSIAEENKDFEKDLEIRLTGNVNPTTLQDLTRYQLITKTKLQTSVPHQEAIRQQKKAQVLLLLIPNTKKSAGILTGKLFEYITSKRPILGIGAKQGDAAAILKETQTGVLVAFDDREGLTKEIKRLYKKYKTNQLKVTPQNIAQYHRKALTAQLSVLLKTK
ncbi:glycosyltransferase [Tenacibaculum maritimum]|uniref:glycosyltransferase n=1 Tax=Tenacibaculum maritimum TaxID=107401 RepID=UPI0012E47C58|nr:glycosyltransferase [Tenacibaculum maritimum]CAA0168253.1 Glycosyltransferase, family GT4 [Tenacibaculum maritimum]